MFNALFTLLIVAIVFFLGGQVGARFPQWFLWTWNALSAAAARAKAKMDALAQAEKGPG